MICPSCENKITPTYVTDGVNRYTEYTCHVCKNRSDTEFKSQEERIAELCDEVKDLLIRKNENYGNSFSKQFEKYGIMSAMIRIDDKINRLHSLTEGGRKDTVGESLIDTCIDAAGYFLLTAVELHKTKEKSNQ